MAEGTTPTIHPVVGAGAVAVDLVADPRVAAMWSEPSALDGYRVGGLAAHLVRALETIRIYVEGEPPGAGDVPIDAATYFTTVLGDHDPHTSEFHESVRSRGEQQVEAGHEALVGKASDLRAWLADADLDPGTPVAVLNGAPMRLGDYLDTRLVELVVHGDDLAASVGLPVPAFPDDATLVVASVLTDVVLLRQPPLPVALALARPDRHRMPGAFDNVVRPG